MPTVEFTGKIESDFECPHDSAHYGAMAVGDRCIICAVEEIPHSADPTFTVAHGGDERLYSGHAYADHGVQGYSEWTPGSPPEIEVGDVDLLMELMDIPYGTDVHVRIDY